jgi:hypothetical protein
LTLQLPPGDFNKGPTAVFLILFIAAFVMVLVALVLMHGAVPTTEDAQLNWGQVLLWSAIAALIFASVGTAAWSFGSAVWEFVA